jgi:class 3 adenylate cyclase
VERRLTAILAADVVGYSRLMGVDETGTVAALKKLRQEVTDPCIAVRQGRIVKTTGDGMLVEFPSVVQAVNCATEMQAARSADLPLPQLDRPLPLRGGVGSTPPSSGPSGRRVSSTFSSATRSERSSCRRPSSAIALPIS